MKLVLAESYNYVLWTSLVVAIQCFITGFAVAARKRYSIFTADFLEKNFGDEHRKAFPGD